MTNAPPSDSGKWGSIRRIYASDNQIRSLIGNAPSTPRLNQPIAVSAINLMGPEPSAG
jgi:hypothetical protein